jgi:hypothetical protein
MSLKNCILFFAASFAFTLMPVYFVTGQRAELTKTHDKKRRYHFSK